LVRSREVGWTPSAMLPLAVSVSGWVTLSQSSYGGQIDDIARQFHGLNDADTPHIQQKLGYLWTQPEDATDRTGLGGGITWQWDPKLCDALIDKFDEDFWFVPFIQCSDLKASMHRAFASWSDNHKDINFVEVTEECKDIGQDYEGCELAEVFVTALPKPNTTLDMEMDMESEDDGGGRMLHEEGAYKATSPTLAMGGGDSAAATALPYARYSATFRYTNGHRPYTRTPDQAAFQSSDATTLSSGTLQRVGKQVTIVDGKVHYLGQVYEVTWVGEPPPTWRTTDYIATVDGEVGGNVTLVEGGMFLNPEAKKSLRVIETIGAKISFNTDFCWYLDSTFCSFFHQLKNVEGLSPAYALLLVQTILFSIFSLAATLIIFQLARVVIGTACHKTEPDRSCRDACRDKTKRFMDEISKWGTIGLTFRLICLWTPPVAYAYLFLPCWSCFDFEGAATHEVGHVLGLSHPDNTENDICTGADFCDLGPGRNSFSAALNGKDADGNWMPVRMNSSSCDLPWDSVRAFDPKIQGGDVAAEIGWPLAASGLRATIMEAFTQHNPSVCLTYDDLEALNVIYPQCEYAISEPVCYKTAYYIGWIRLAVWVGIPIIFMLLLIMLIAASVRKHQLKRMSSLRKLAREKSGKLKLARAEVRRAACEAAQLSEALELQQATEEKRVQARAKLRSSLIIRLTQLRAANQGAPDAERGPSFPRQKNSGTPASGSGELSAGKSKSFGAGLRGSMKKISSALGLQKGSARSSAVVAETLEERSVTEQVPEQYRLHSAEATETTEERVAKSQVRAMTVERGSCQSIEEVSEASDKGVQGSTASLPAASRSLPPPRSAKVASTSEMAEP